MAAKKDVTITRVNRQSGTKITVTREKDKWVSRCEDHGATAEHTSRAARDKAARTPVAWCGDCAKAAKASERKAARETKAEERPAA